MDLDVLAEQILELLCEASAAGALSFSEAASRLGVSEVAIADAGRRLEDRGLVVVAAGVIYLRLPS